MFSALAMDHVQKPLHRGPLEGATHFGESGTPGDGPYVQIWLRIKEGLIEEAAFRTPGCPSSTAIAGVLCTLATGRDANRLKALTRFELLAVVGEIPPGKDHYADKALTALHRALMAGELR